MLSTDRLAHLWWGMAMVGLMQPLTGPWPAVIAAAMIAVLKEVVGDKRDPEFEPHNFFVTCVGACIAGLVIWVVTP
jgi:hypothetical protein